VRRGRLVRKRLCVGRLNLRGLCLRCRFESVGFNRRFGLRVGLIVRRGVERRLAIEGLAKRGVGFRLTKERGRAEIDLRQRRSAAFVRLDGGNLLRRTVCGLAPLVSVGRCLVA
jgi:hypothetical protein